MNLVYKTRGGGRKHYFVDFCFLEFQGNVPGYNLSLAYALATWWPRPARIWLILDKARNRCPNSGNQDQDTIDNTL